MKHTLKLIYRNFRKNLSVNLINVGGLTLSMAVVLMLSAYCYSELTTDFHHDKVDQKFLIGCSTDFTENEITTPGVLSDHLKNEIPDIRKVVRLAGTWSPPVVKTEIGESFETNLMYADDGFFDMFSYTSIAGDIRTALVNPLSAVLSKDEAIRLFGSTSVVGQPIIINNQYQVIVTAVIEESNYNSFLDFKVLLPVSAIPTIPLIDNDFNNWNNMLFLTFIELGKNPSIKDIEVSIESIFDAHKTKEDESALPIRLIPVDDVYFSNIDNSYLDFLLIGNKWKVLVLTMVAILILLMAIINYLNISSYGLRDRLHQSGIFKIIGANRIHLFKNNIIEAILTFALSVWLALMLTELLRPIVYYYTGLKYSSELLFSPAFIMVSLLIAVLFGILSNLSNSFKTSSSPPINSIRKNYNSKSGTSIYQGTLVVVQFCATISLISFTLLINKQIEFSSKDLGFAKENILAIEFTNQLNKEVLKERLGNQSSVEKISFSTFYPGKPFSQWGASLIINGEEKYAQFTVMDGDLNFIDMLGLELVSGRNFSDDIITDKNKILINESFVKKYNLGTLTGTSINNRYEIIGVIKDFHFKSKNHAIGPLAILNRGAVSHCLVETHSSDFNDLLTTVASIKDICAELSPDFPVEVSFLDAAIENMYQSEVQFRRTFTFFAGCAIFISCLGILALSLFASQQRTKEIGIRKVNGAHMEDILMLLNKDFIKWVGIAFVTSLPIAWFAMNKWLENFAYKTEISWWIFLLGGAAALMIALLTVSWQSWNAARKNPVDALRYE